MADWQLYSEYKDAGTVVPEFIEGSTVSGTVDTVRLTITKYDAITGAALPDVVREIEVSQIIREKNRLIADKTRIQQRATQEIARLDASLDSIDELKTDLGF